MTVVGKKDQGRSVHQRLLNLARNRGDDFNLILTRYGMERLLYRLSLADRQGRFVLKGASMFLVWQNAMHRVTRDADLLGLGVPDLEEIRGFFRKLCSMSLPEDDCVYFLEDSVKVREIREANLYDGLRVKLVAMLDTARIPLQVDIGFGDSIVPDPEPIEFPVLLGDPVPRLKGYVPSTMVAEKFEAMVKLGMANSRMKDFYDIVVLSRQFRFKGDELSAAIESTFKRRRTPLPEEVPTALSPAFHADAQKQVQWRAFLRKVKPAFDPGDLTSAVAEIRAFIMSVVTAMTRSEPTPGTWRPEKGWSS